MDVMDYAFEVLMKVGVNAVDYPLQAREINSYIEKIISENSDKIAEAKFEEKEEKFRVTERVNAREEFRAQQSHSISGNSPLISKSMRIDGCDLNVKAFIYNIAIPRQYCHEGMVRYNPYSGCYEKRNKKYGNCLISRVDVICIFIVNPSPPNICDAFVVFTKGRVAPFILWDGDLSDNRITSRFPFERKSEDKKYFCEAVRLAIGTCENTYYYTSPRHAGWNRTSDGAWFFVHSGTKAPLLAGLYQHKEDKSPENKRRLDNVFDNIKLCDQVHDAKELIDIIHDNLKNHTILKTLCAFSIMSRLLPFFSLNGLRQDRILTIEATDDMTILSLLAFLHNTDTTTFNAAFSSDGKRVLRDEIQKHVDCTFIVRHRNYQDSSKDLSKVLNLFSEILYNDDVSDRTLPTLIIDTAGLIPECTRTINLAPDNVICSDDITSIKKLLGEFHNFFICSIENNFDAFAESLRKNIALSKEYLRGFPDRINSASLLMIISSALLLKDFTLFLSFLCGQFYTHSTLPLNRNF